MDSVYIETTIVGHIAGRVHPDPKVATRQQMIRKPTRRKLDFWRLTPICRDSVQQAVNADDGRDAHLAGDDGRVRQAAAPLMVSVAIDCLSCSRPRQVAPMASYTLP
jgi:hypothetical protein